MAKILTIAIPALLAYSLIPAPFNLPGAIVIAVALGLAVISK